MNIVHAAATMLALLLLCAIGPSARRRRNPPSLVRRLHRDDLAELHLRLVRAMHGDRTGRRRLVHAESLVFAVWRTRADDRRQAEQRARQAALGSGAKRD
jgi:hypothetical protein